eukprot:gene26989-32605_t
MVERMVKGKVSPYLPVPDGIRRPEYWLSGQPAESPNNVKIYTTSEIPKIRKSARLARKILEYALKLAVPGMSLDRLDQLAQKAMVDHLCYPSPLNYYGFPKAICTSVNDVACHGIPDDYVLKDGDIIKIDVSLYHDGYHGDNCGTVVVGENPDPKLIRLIDVTKEAVQKAIAVCAPGRCISEIGKSIQSVARQNNYSIVKQFCGHGTGKLLHMPPLIFHYENDEKLKMVPGMVFTIEPIFTEGKEDIYTWEDGWTAATTDGSWSAQIEHEVLITDKGVEVLTVLEE